MTPEQLDLGQIEARYETAREAPNWQGTNLLIEALTSSMYDVPELVAEVRRLRSTVEQIRELVLPSADQAEDENLYGLVVDIRRLVYEHDPAIDTERTSTPMTFTRVHTHITFADPYLDCNQCGRPVDRWHDPDQCGCDTAATNEPCGCKSGVTSACPSWSPVDGCRCIEHLGSRTHRDPIPKEQTA